MDLRLGSRRDGAERYLLVTIVAFAVTVAGTRWFLDLTGYPKVGGGSLHIAHMLWGGLLLVLAALLPLLFAGRRVLMLSALAAGVGVGLFIDEVGKFITSTNDYFFAPAAPLIYGAVLLLAAVWLVVRRRRESPGDAMEAGLEAIREGFAGRLSTIDRDRVVEGLRTMIPADPSEAALAAAEADLLASPAMEDRLRQPGWVAAGGPRQLIARLLPRRLELAIIVIALVLSALQALFAALLLLALAWTSDPLQISVPAGPVEFPQDPVWTVLVLVMAVGVGAACGVAAALLLVGRARGGVRLAVAATLVNLVGGGLLTFYVAQFGAVSSAVGQVILLGLLLDFGDRHVGE